MKSAGPPLDPNRGSPSSGRPTIGDRAVGVERAAGNGSGKDLLTPSVDVASDVSSGTGRRGQPVSAPSVGVATRASEVDAEVGRFAVVSR
jgi:hypothetical protein